MPSSRSRLTQQEAPEEDLGKIRKKYSIKNFNSVLMCAHHSMFVALKIFISRPHYHKNDAIVNGSRWVFIRERTLERLEKPL